MRLVVVELAGRGQVGLRIAEVVDSEVLAGFPDETGDKESGLQASCDGIY